MSLRNRVGINAGDPTRPALLEGLTGPPPWTIGAPCSSADPEAFFPEKGGSTREAKKVCTSCDVRQECLDYALIHETAEWNIHGIWGGLTVFERRKLIRARSRAS